MKLRQSLCLVPLSLFLACPPADAADKAKTSVIDCAGKSLADEIGKLDRSVANVLEFTGDCAGTIRIDGQRDLTLVALEGASISGAYVPGDRNASTNALEVHDSRVTVQDAVINAGNYGLLCTDRSTCILREVDVLGGHDGVAAQGQSGIEILGIGQILDSENSGVGVYGASSVNVRPDWDLAFDAAAPGPLISGHSFGVWVQDGSFFRSDNATISGNGAGVWAHRDAVVKMFVNRDIQTGSYLVPDAGVKDNGSFGILLRNNSTAQVGLPITGNGGPGIRLGALSYLQNAGLYFDSNGGGEVSCEDATAVSNYCPNLGQVIGDLQAQLAALEAAANATLEQKVSGKTFAAKSTGHGIAGFNPFSQALPFVLQNATRDFSAGEGTLSLNADGTYDLHLDLVVIPAGPFIQGSGDLGTYYQRYEFPIDDSGTWEVDPGTNEILLSSGARLQASPNGEVLTTMSNETRLVEGDPSVSGGFNSFVSDAVYIRQP